MTEITAYIGLGLLDRPGVRTVEGSGEYLDGFVGDSPRQPGLPFYNQPQAVGDTARLFAKQVEGGRTVERAALVLEALPDTVRRVVVSVNMDVETGLFCDALTGATLTVEVGDSTWEFQPPGDAEIKAMAVAEIYRHRSGNEQVWKLRAVGLGWADGLAGLARDHGVVVD
ncbi:TerD family protein [Streptomyces kaniharaensis]|uniref:TerD family protein n=1 Tax=Streptomyces kaniharaensis TaxID=212423 RepID=A0A6N7L0L2_9ACTN|nr:TerD family protein [Streptomyces kaniharaensis]MQS17171.1 TerD family protein [Streptomyces kaniharaensis]